jgi:hypothetical protein
MSEKSSTEQPSLLIIAAFCMALIGVALGFGAYTRIGDTALGLARVEMVGASVTRKNLDLIHERMVAMESRIAELEKRLAVAEGADSAAADAK